jgi:nitroreductase
MVATSIQGAPAAAGAMTKTQAQRWDGVIFLRRSVRTYDRTPLRQEAADAIRSLRPEPLGTARVRHVLVEGEAVVSHVLTGLVGSYGRIIGAPALLFFIAQMADPYALAGLGYLGQQVILEATALELATCWVGGAFRKDVVGQYVDLAPGEQVICVSPVGTAAPTAGMRRMHDLSLKWLTPQRGGRKPLSAIVSGGTGEPLQFGEPWIAEALEAARWAASSVNRQPWRFRVTDGRVSVGYEPTPGLAAGAQDSKALDCGIAMANFAVAARARSIAGRWELTPSGETLAEFRQEA